LSYSDVQKVIERGNIDATIGKGHRSGDVVADIKNLANLAKKLRAQRFANGALSLESLKLTFKLDDSGLPIDCGLRQRTPAHLLVEEVG
jgi:protein SSD1